MSRKEASHAETQIKGTQCNRNNDGINMAVVVASLDNTIVFYARLRDYETETTNFGRRLRYLNR